MVEFFPQDPRYYLQIELAHRLKRRPHYSLRAFARDLEVSPAALSGFLTGKTALSAVRIQSFAKTLKLNPEHADHWQDLLIAMFGKTPAIKKKASLKISQRLGTSKKFIDNASFQYISNWESLALLEILSFDKKISDKVIARHLNISQVRLQSMIQTLLRLNLIYWNKDRWIPTEEDSFVGSDVPSEAIKKFHTQILKKAGTALMKQNLEQREFRSVIFSMRKKDLPNLKKDLQIFWMEQIGKYATPNNNDSIYCFSMQLFNMLDGEMDHV